MPPGNENSASLEGQNALRVKVAELCPDRIRCHNYTDNNGAWEWSSDGQHWNECYDGDPLSDLNACAELRRSLPKELHILYVAALARVVHGDLVPAEQVFTKFHLIDATAEQHCRAFIAVTEQKAHPESATMHRVVGYSVEGPPCESLSSIAARI